MIQLEVLGVPQPQGNKTGFVVAGKVRMVEGRRPASRRAFKDWREAINYTALEHRRAHRLEIIDEPVDLWLLFMLPRPPSAPKRRRFPHARPDVDKLVRAVLDAITKVLITNDSRVVTVHAAKRYAAADEVPGMSLSIHPAGALALTVTTATEGAIT